MDMQDERKEQERREAVHKIALRLAEQEIHWNAKYYSSFSLPPMRFYKKAWAVLIRQERAAAASTSSAPSFSSSLDWDVQILGNDQAREEGRSNNATEEEEEGEEEQEEQEEEQEAEERINVFEAVPTEVVLLIINHLEAWELRYVVPRVCRQWRALALDWSVQGKVVKDYLRERSRWEKDPANREEYKKRRLVVAPPAETIQIQLGRRATDVGHKYWESLYYEHSIDPHTGEYKVKPNGAGPISEAQVSGLSFSFSEMEDGTYKPRTLFVDTHSSPLFDQQQAFYESPLFPPSCTGRFYLVDDTYSLDEWSCNNTSLSAMMDHLSRLAEKCDNLSNFDFLADIGDLDGGYATDFVFNATVDAFMTTRPVAFCLFSPKSNPSADLIRSTAMAFNSLIELTDATFLLSDLAMTTNNKNIMMTTEQKDRIAAKAFSGITCPMRFPVQGNEAMGSWLKFSTTFNPYPRLHCYSVAYAQVMPQLQSFTPQHDISSQLAAKLFHPSSSLTIPSSLPSSPSNLSTASSTVIKTEGIDLSFACFRGATSNNNHYRQQPQREYISWTKVGNEVAEMNRQRESECAKQPCFLFQPTKHALCEYDCFGEQVASGTLVRSSTGPAAGIYAYLHLHLETVAKASDDFYPDYFYEHYSNVEDLVREFYLSGNGDDEEYEAEALSDGEGTS